MMRSVSLKRGVIFVHRWLGATLCLAFLLWFPSGIVMMYWDFPSVSADDRLERSPSLDAAKIRISVADAFATLNPLLDPSFAPAQIRLSTRDGRPAYSFRNGHDEAIVYADNGERQHDIRIPLMTRVAAAWTGQPASDATIAAIDVDQWTVEGPFRDLQPIWKYSWPDGEQVYVSQATGDVVQYTTRSSRLGAYLGAIPHWLYFTPLRRHPLAWRRVVIGSSGAGACTAMLGLIIGCWMYSPAKRPRRSGVLSGIPYRGLKRWHTVLGLTFGLGAATWAFSGLLSMDPFPSRPAGPAGGHVDAAATMTQALRDRLPVAAIAAQDPRLALTKVAGLNVKELELASFAGEPLYIATLGRGDTRVVPMNGAPRTGFDPRRVVDVLKKAAGPGGVAEIRTLERYDRYYLDRRGQRPLPVLLVRLNDAEHSRFYIDPRTARIVGSYSTRNWVTRWLYHGLHSLDFPWLYSMRPLWDIVLLTFMVGGAALSATAAILAWRVVGRTLAAWAGAGGTRADLAADGVDGGR
jgi:hypothetical protein